MLLPKLTLLFLTERLKINSKKGARANINISILRCNMDNTGICTSYVRNNNKPPSWVLSRLCARCVVGKLSNPNSNFAPSFLIEIESAKSKTKQTSIHNGCKQSSLRITSYISTLFCFFCLYVAEHIRVRMRDFKPEAF